MTTDSDILALLQQIQQQNTDILVTLQRGQRSGFNRMFESQTSLATDVAGVDSAVAGVDTSVGNVNTTVGSIAEGLGTLTPTSIAGYSANSLGPALGAIGAGTPASGAIGSTTAIYIPFALSQSVRATAGFAFNGATVDGNIDLGVYDEDFNLLASTGATAQSGTSTIQQVNYTSAVTLGVGRYYMALCIASGTATFFRWTINANFFRALGVLNETGISTLPATATPVVPVGSTPVFGVIIEL